MKKNPKLSAYIPTYNRAVYLPETINSIIEQKYKNWELIIVDDGSTDSTPDLIDFYVKKYPDKIKYFRRKKNMGIAYTRNEACSHCTGDIIVVCDSDDVNAFGMLSSKKKLERFVEIARYFEKHDVDIIYSNWFICDQNLIPAVHRETPKELLLKDGSLDLEKLMEFPVIAQPTLAFKKEVWDKVHYNDKQKCGEDWQWLIDVARAGFKWGQIRKPLVKYRQHPNQISILKKKEVDEYDTKAKAKGWE